jgi:hypothetical protein
MTSPLAKKLVGVFIPDDPVSAPPVVSWVQEECRKGSLQCVVEEFAKAQVEPLDVGLVRVESMDDKGINCVIPCRMFDTESPSAFQTEVRFRIDPADRTAQRTEACQ